MSHCLSTMSIPWCLAKNIARYAVKHQLLRIDQLQPMCRSRKACPLKGKRQIQVILTSIVGDQRPEGLNSSADHPIRSTMIMM